MTTTQLRNLRVYIGGIYGDGKHYDEISMSKQTLNPWITCEVPNLQRVIVADDVRPLLRETRA